MHFDRGPWNTNYSIDLVLDHYLLGYYTNLVHISAKLIIRYHIQGFRFLQPLVPALMMAMVLGAVFVADDHRDGHFYGVGHGLFDVHRHVFLNMYWVGPVDGHLDGVRHGLIHGVRDMLFNGVGSGHWDLDGVRHVLLYMDGVRPVIRNLHGVRHGFLYWVGHKLLNWVRHWFRYMHRVGPIDMNLEGNMDLFVDGVGSGHMYGHLNRVWNLLLYWVGSWDVHLDGNVNLLGDWVRLGYEYLDRDRPVDWHMYGVRNLLLNGVGLGNMDRYFDDLPYGVGHVFDDRVGLRYVNFHGISDFLFNWVGNVLLYGIWDRDVLDDRDRFVDLSVSMPDISSPSATTVSATTVSATTVSAVTAITVSVAQTDIK